MKLLLIVLALQNPESHSVRFAGMTAVTPRRRCTCTPAAASALAAAQSWISDSGTRA